MKSCYLFLQGCLQPVFFFCPAPGLTFFLSPFPSFNPSLSTSLYFPFGGKDSCGPSERSVWKCTMQLPASPRLPTPGTECEKRALHLMPDWPNLLLDSRAFLFPAAQWERGQKWCGRREESTVIVSRSVEIPHPPNTHPHPPLLSSPLILSWTAPQLKGEGSLGSKRQLLCRITKKTVCTHIWITFNLSHEGPYIEHKTVHCPQIYLFFNTTIKKSDCILPGNKRFCFTATSFRKIKSQTSMSSNIHNITLHFQSGQCKGDDENNTTTVKGPHKE